MRAFYEQLYISANKVFGFVPQQSLSCIYAPRFHPPPISPLLAGAVGRAAQPFTWKLHNGKVAD